MENLMQQHVGEVFDDFLKASYEKPRVEELPNPWDENRRVSVMETQCDCGICKTGDDCLLGFCSDTFIVNADGIIVGIIEES